MTTAPSIDRTQPATELLAEDPARAHFRHLEGQWLLQNGLAARSREISIARPKMQAHLLDVADGDPVLLVHGGGGCSALWAPLMRLLPGARMLAVDRPGCGLSDGFDYRGVDLRRHAIDFLSSAIDTLGLERVPIIANSMGGSWAFWLALERPASVRSIVQFGCPANILGTSAPLPFRLLGVPMLNRLMLAMEPPSRKQARRTFERMGHGETIRAGGIPDELFDLHAASEAVPTSATAWLTLLERTVQPTGARPGIGLSGAQLSRLDVPVLFVWGDRDPFGHPDVGRAAVAAMPRATIETIPGAGHLPWLDQPERCAEIAGAFLSGGYVPR